VSAAQVEESANVMKGTTEMILSLVVLQQNQTLILWIPIPSGMNIYQGKSNGYIRSRILRMFRDKKYFFCALYSEFAKNIWISLNKYNSNEEVVQWGRLLNKLTVFLKFIRHYKTLCHSISLEYLWLPLPFHHYHRHTTWTMNSL